ncbi:MAG: phosphoribosylformylglycinamidine cyclo-ligase, partial [Desulfuromonadales bacterium]|nr:phosphoribosylformylglycinamidine cyclo-ligase [Desulfuromonadales bacterium]
LAEDFIDGLAHVTGGGLAENVIRMLKQEHGVRIDRGAWQRPEIFDWLQREGNISDVEMRRTFNCGIGMVAAVSKAKVREARDRITAAGIECFEMGEVVQADNGERAKFD